MFVTFFRLIIRMTRYIEGAIVLSSGQKVFRRSWIADEEKLNVLGIHGFVEHSGRYDNFGKKLADSGITVNMFDLRGHGRTATNNDLGVIGNFEDFVSDSIDYATMLSEENGGKLFLYGHSMGGLIVLHVLTRNDKHIIGAITSGPSTIMTVNPLTKFLLLSMNSVSPGRKVKLPIRPEYLSHDTSVVKSYISDPLVCKNPSVNLIYQMYIGSKSIWPSLSKTRVPILMLHGGDDRIVPPKATQESFEKIGSEDKKIRIFNGMFHEIHNEVNKEEVYSEIITWLKGHESK
jgi:alpha-beta hydrolase superfamily lysophospholipase